MVFQNWTKPICLRRIEVNTTIPEQLAVQFLNFDKYEVNIEAYPDKVFTASLKELEKKPTAEGYPLHLFLDYRNNPKDQNQAKVSAGMSCRINIILKSTQLDEGMVIIPITAVFEGSDDDNPSIWLIDPENNTVKKQNVVIGHIVGNDAIQILEGVTIGQQIVVAGVHRLTEGDKVNILESH